jgi:hypothetical protein
MTTGSLLMNLGGVCDLIAMVSFPHMWSVCPQQVYAGAHDAKLRIPLAIWVLIGLSAMLFFSGAYLHVWLES